MARFLFFSLFVIGMSLSLMQCAPATDEEKVKTVAQDWTDVLNRLNAVEANLQNLKNYWKVTYDKMKLDDATLKSLSIDHTNKLTYYTDQYLATGGEVKKLEDEINNYSRLFKSQSEKFFNAKVRLDAGQTVDGLKELLADAKEDQKEADFTIGIFEKNQKTIQGNIDLRYKEFEDHLKEIN